MNAASSTDWTAGSPDETASAAYGVGLIGVAKGFARSVLGLGRVMSGTIARLTNEGADPHSANSGFDFMAVLNLLQRAVMLADALKARLLTPAVTAAMARFRAVRSFAGQARPQAAAQPEADDTLWRIAYVRADKQRRQGWLEAIEDMSDREVLTHIYATLRQASAMLGDTAVAAQVEALACKASALLGDEADEVAPGHGTPSHVTPETTVTRPVVHETSDEGPHPQRTLGVRPPWRTVGRGPP